MSEAAQPKEQAQPRAETVQVFARFRPLSALEKTKDARCCADFQERSVVITNQDEGTVHRFSFERVYAPETTQQALYERVGTPIVSDVLKGYNATIFAYGQTGSGKTYTMLGPPVETGSQTPASGRRQAPVETNSQEYELNGPSAGIVPRAVYDLFHRIKKAPHTTRFMVKMSYVEVYMERLRDLLATGGGAAPTLREDSANKRFFVDGCQEVEVTSAGELLERITMGTRNRATVATKMNEHSSRSHSIVTIEVTSADDMRDTVLKGRLHLVDLAGSEKVSKTHALGQQLEEAKLINRSLVSLSTVIAALSERKNQPGRHIPYRDSKLTRLLMDSLGGNARTALVVCCSPSTWNLAETTSTLRFGSLATQVENHAVINQELSPAEMKVLIAKLEEDLRLARSKGGGGGNLSAGDLAELQSLREDAKQLELLQRQYQKQSDALDALREAYDEASTRETLALTRADAAEALTDSLQEECDAWAAAHRAAATDLARLRSKYEAQRRGTRYLRSALAQTHDVIEATREELCSLRLAASTMQLDYDASVKRVEELEAELAAAKAAASAEAAAALAPAADAGESAASPIVVTATGPQADAAHPRHSDPASGGALDFADPTSQATIVDSVSIEEFEAAMRRAVAAEKDYKALQEQWRELVTDSTSAKLELEFCMKRLGLRNERINNLTAAVKKQKLDLKQMQDVLAAEKKRYSDALSNANSEAAYWRGEAEKLRETVVQLKQAKTSASPMAAGSPSARSTSLMLASTPTRSLGGHFARYIRGGDLASPASGQPPKSSAGRDAGFDKSPSPSA